jgi:hypothetical protein
MMVWFLDGAAGGSSLKTAESLIQIGQQYGALRHGLAGQIEIQFPNFCPAAARLVLKATKLSVSLPTRRCAFHWHV